MRANANPSLIIEDVTSEKESSREESSREESSREESSREESSREESSREESSREESSREANASWADWAKSVLSRSYYNTFEMTGLDPIENKINGKPIEKEKRAERYLLNTSVQVTSFFTTFTGFRDDSYANVIVSHETGKVLTTEDATDYADFEFDPTLHRRDVKREPLINTIFKNVFMRPERSSSRGWFVAWWVFSPIIIPVRLAWMLANPILTTTKNIGKFFIEFLPLLLSEFFTRVIKLANATSKKLEDRWAYRRPGQTVGFVLGNLAARFGLGVAKFLILSPLLAITTVWHWLGRAMMSPEKAAQIAEKKFGTVGWVASWAFSVASAFVMSILTWKLAMTYAPVINAWLKESIGEPLAKLITEYVNDHAWLKASVDWIANVFEHTIPDFWAAHIQWFFELSAFKAVGGWIDAGFNAIVQGVQNLYALVSPYTESAALWLSFKLGVIFDVTAGAMVGTLGVLGALATAVYDKVASLIGSRFDRPEIKPVIALANVNIPQRDFPGVNLAVSQHVKHVVVAEDNLNERRINASAAAAQIIPTGTPVNVSSLFNADASPIVSSLLDGKSAVSIAPTAALFSLPDSSTPLLDKNPAVVEDEKKGEKKDEQKVNTPPGSPRI